MICNITLNLPTEEHDINWSFLESGSMADIPEHLTRTRFHNRDTCL